jgi:molybdate transport system substrate-binding protein
MKRKYCGFFLLAFFILGGLGGVWAAEIHLSAAVSLREVILELSDGYMKRNPGMRIITNFGGSGALARQIENGAPADLFVSANREWMDYLNKENLMDPASITTMAYNTLVFVGKGDKEVSNMKALSQLDRIAIGSPKSVPAGEYAMAALTKAGLAPQIEKKLVMARDVREALLYAERGEVDGAFVYKTDALQGQKTKILFLVPEDLYPRVTYPMGLTMAGSKNPAAGAFHRFLLAGEARGLLEKFGFTVP